jgi:plasmid maintenance system antidote protein VapI
MNKNPIERYAEEEFPTGSITALANAAEVTYGTVHKAIQGLYSKIPAKLADYIAANSEYDVEHWQNEYSLWVKRELEILKNDIINGKFEAEALYVPADFISKTYKDFSEWREALSYSQVDFCKTFLLHQGIINKYELGQMKNIPVSLVERLRFLEKDTDYINAIDDLPIRKK